MTDDLDLANASIQRGARLALVGFPAFAIFAIVVIMRLMLEIMGPAVSALLILLVVGLTAFIFAKARQFSGFRLAADGVYAPDGWTLPWNAITRASYVNGWLSLQDGAGREASVAILFATSQATVLAAIRARLPDGIQIANDPVAGK